ncbi:WYL domain-containing protein [Pseudenhygromyxa sp. WMMC2535]|uniref:helix-turn-helix transcriptional regulator n=1 Tax=Pseudenhygromyxa sp. WMMC2535 TaxID=2712867 RepID=UPI00155526D7|nr:WYL domain-containing protein [Pseudenhygromyxa sp. WMMC2535]NVB38787.1 WYL domain-containing protein [Pseudenhygromyxa sp. WMMC2535]
MTDGPSELVKDTARVLLRHLRDNPEGASKEVLANVAGVSHPSIQRALTWLRDACDSPVEFDRSQGRWVLRDSLFTLPLSDPEPADLSAVLFAEALLAPIADEEITVRLRRLSEQMDAEIRERGDLPSAGARPGSLVATLTTGSRTDPRVLSVLLGAVTKQVVQIRYASPWSAEGGARVHDVEPWQLRLHDGNMYLRAWSRTHADARSFRVAQIEAAEVIAGLSPREPVPSQDRIWGDHDPAFGIDQDRPGTATLRIRAPMARWVHHNVWDPGQEDRWIEQGELLERKVAYRSCRELARRLLSIGDALVSIEPPELREAVLGHARAILAALA